MVKGIEAYCVELDTDDGTANWWLMRRVMEIEANGFERGRYTRSMLSVRRLSLPALRMTVPSGLDGSANYLKRTRFTCGTSRQLGPISCVWCSAR